MKNKKNLLIFGDQEMAEIAHFYFHEQSEYNVVAFVVDEEYLNKDSLCGLPIVSLKSASERFKASEHDMFVALGYSKLNQIREQKYHEVTNLGYDLASFISHKATIASNAIIGKNCFIFEDNTIQPYVNIGNNVVVWSGNHIGHHSEIGDNCFITSHVVISGGVRVEENCFLGVNATLRDHITIGKRSVIGAGALILSNVDPDGVYLAEETKRHRVPSNRLRKI